MINRNHKENSDDITIRQYEERDKKAVYELFTIGMMGLVPAVWKGTSKQFTAVYSVLPLLAIITGKCDVVFYLAILYVFLILLWYWYAGYEFRQYVAKSIDGDLKNISTFYSKERNSVMLVAEYRGDVIGSVALDQKTPQLAELRRMSVTPTCRGKGVATKLLLSFVKFAREHNYKAVVLSTSEYQVAAMNLYLRHGFYLAACHTELVITFNHLVFSLNNTPLTGEWVREIHDVSLVKAFPGKKITRLIK